MASRITWRNSPINIGAGAAAFGNTAANFTDLIQRSAGNLREAGETYRANKAEELTNEAIAAQLRGEQVAFNPLVDQQTLYDIDYNERALKEDILASQSSRALTDQQTSELAYQNTPEYRAWDKSLRDAQQRTEEEKARAATSRADTERTNAKRLARTEEETRKLGEQKDNINIEENRLQQEFAQKELQRMAPDGNYTPEMEREAFAKAKAYIEGEDGYRLLERYAFDNGYDPDAFLESKAGVRYNQAIDIEAEAARQNEEAAKERAAVQAKGELFLSKGDTKYLGLDENKERVWLSDDEATADSVGNYDDAIGRLQFHGVNTRDFQRDGEAKDVLEQARKVLKNGSLLAGSMEGFIEPDGSFDARGYQAALGKNMANMRWDLINQKRRERQLPPIPLTTEDIQNTGSTEDANKANTVKALKESLTEGLAKRNIDFQIHPDKDNKAVLENLNTLLKEVETGRDKFSNRWLSPEEIAESEQLLIQSLLAASSGTPSPSEIGLKPASLKF